LPLISSSIFCLFLGRVSTLNLSDADTSTAKPLRTSPLWENWLDGQDLGHLKSPPTAPNPHLIFQKYIDLAKIIHDILCLGWEACQNTKSGSKHWDRIVLNAISARLWNWHDGLPGDFRWNRWGSNVDDVHLSLASMHMLYHTAMITLHRPFLKGGTECESISQSPPPSHNTDSGDLCDASSDVIVSILRRFNAQHSLFKAPMLFVHGTIIAIDATIATTRCLAAEISTMEGTLLPALDSALTQLSHASPIATEAKLGLRKFIQRKRLEQQSCAMFPPVIPDLYIDSPLLEEQSLGYNISSLQSAEPQTPEEDFPAIFQWNHLQDADRDVWDAFGNTDNCSPLWINPQGYMSCSNGIGDFVDHRPAVGYESDHLHNGAMPRYTEYQ
jgi:hypothetical protein